MDIDSIVMDEHVSEELDEEFREMFALFDRDGDGSIDIREFQDTLKTLGQNPSQMELDQMLHDIDVNGDGEIDFEEFKHLMFKRMKGTDANEEIKDAFLIMDCNGRGYITAVELFQIITGMGEKISPTEAKEMVKAADTKHPEKIDYEDFVKLVHALVSKQ